jgi:hypothetical protein
MRFGATWSVLTVAVLTLATASSTEAGNGKSGPDFESYQWSLIKESDRFDGSWTPRAGLQVVELHNRFYLMGGRTPNPPSVPPIIGDSVIWGDVWTSEDRGATWVKILDTNTPGHWPARAYFQTVTRGSSMYVLGGQNFRAGPVECPPGVPVCSDFFNDVWRSNDGVHWTQMTSDAGWEPRAGLSSVVFGGELFVMGGSQNDDSSIGGPGGPARLYFNDVWKSRDGSSWELVTDDAPWAPRAGAVVVVKNGYMYLLGGEEGFICDPLPFCDPPYFNDVWRSRDGANWELVTDDADWSPRPGHQAAVLLNHIILFGGFGLLENPMDVWVSKDGANWKQVSDSPWNADSQGDIKYDFDVLAVRGGRRGLRPSIFTFGGDRETFDFADPTNFLNVDNDVWQFSPFDD